MVKPYLKQWAPPEFSATFPPIEHTTWLEGSGGKKWSGATAWETARLLTPGSTTTRWLGRSTSRMRRSRVSAIRIPSATGSAPPDSPDPAPRATQGTPARWQAATTRRTSSPLPGRTTALGTTAYWSSPSDS